MIEQLLAYAKKYWVFVMLAVCPIAYGNSGESLRGFQEHFLQYMSIGFICLFLENIWLSLFMLLNVFLYIQGGGQVGSMQVLNILFGCLVFKFSREWFRKNKFEDCYTPIMIALGLSLLFAILQKLGLDPLGIPQASNGDFLNGPLTQPIGLFGIQMAHSIFLAMCIPIVASINIFLAPLLLFPVYLCQSSAGMLSAISALGFYLFHLYRRLFWIFIAFLVIGGGLFIFKDFKTDPKTMESRFPLWSAVIKHSLHNYFGYGPDSFRNYNTMKNFKFHSDDNYKVIMTYSPTNNDSDIISTYYSPSNDQVAVLKMNENALKNGLPKNGYGTEQFNTFDDPHNEYIKMFFEYGILGVLLLIGFMNQIVQRFRLAIKDKELVTITACLIVFFVSSLTQFPLSLARLAIFFPFLIGAFYARTDLNA